MRSTCMPARWSSLPGWLRTECWQSNCGMPANGLSGCHERNHCLAVMGLIIWQVGNDGRGDSRLCSHTLLLGSASPVSWDRLLDSCSMLGN